MIGIFKYWTLTRVSGLFDFRRVERVNMNTGPSIDLDNGSERNCDKEKKLNHIAVSKQLIALDATVRSFLWSDSSETAFGFRIGCLQSTNQWDPLEQLKKPDRKGDIIRLHYKWNPILQDLLRNCRLARSLSRIQTSNDEREDMEALLQTVTTCLKEDLDRVTFLLPKRPDNRSQQMFDDYRRYMLEMDPSMYATLYHIACDLRTHSAKLGYFLKTLG